MLQLKQLISVYALKSWGNLSVLSSILTRLMPFNLRGNCARNCPKELIILFIVFSWKQQHFTPLYKFMDTYTYIPFVGQDSTCVHIVEIRLQPEEYRDIRLTHQWKYRFKHVSEAGKQQHDLQFSIGDSLLTYSFMTIRKRIKLDFEDIERRIGEKFEKWKAHTLRQLAKSISLNLIYHLFLNIL